MAVPARTDWFQSSKVVYFYSYMYQNSIVANHFH